MGALLNLFPGAHGAALKHLHLQETVLLEDDSETMINLVGKRVVPILVKDDGNAMLESMDMVAYIDGTGKPILIGATTQRTRSLGQCHRR